MKQRIIDASTLLAYLQGETGSKEAGQYCVNAAISAVNLSEVFQKAMRHGSFNLVQAIVQQAAIEVIPFSREQAAKAAELHGLTLGKGISLADRACLALGAMTDLPVVTGDNAWQDLDVGVELVLFRSRANAS